MLEDRVGFPPPATDGAGNHVLGGSMVGDQDDIRVDVASELVEQRGETRDVALAFDVSGAGCFLEETMREGPGCL